MRADHRAACAALAEPGVDSRYLKQVLEMDSVEIEAAIPVSEVARHRVSVDADSRSCHRLRLSPKLIGVTQYN
jgi:hypothetical protein